jgi:hypothetical protein
MEKLKLRVMLEIYGNNNNLRLNEEIEVSEMLTIQQGAEILNKFSELAKSIAIKGK